MVLNKSDQVNTQQLMRVYGALMWSLGKVISTPEVVRVYIGSFWDQPFLHSENRALFEAESADLFEDLQSLPRNAALRKLNDLIKRARLAKVNVIINLIRPSSTNYKLRKKIDFFRFMHSLWLISMTICLQCLEKKRLKPN